MNVRIRMELSCYQVIKIPVITADNEGEAIYIRVHWLRRAADVAFELSDVEGKVKVEIVFICHLQ